MKLAVTDANIFIDLIKMEILGYLFNIGIEIHTTVEILDQLNEPQRQILNQYIQSLKVTKFTAQELQQATAMPAPAALEFPDKSVVFLALKLEASVLTGDGPLRKFCTSKHLDVRGIIWLFDTFLEQELISYQIAIDKMKLLMSFNDRLPKNECLERLKKWEDNKDN